MPLASKLVEETTSVEWNEDRGTLPCSGGSTTGRTAAGIASYTAREHWPEFFSLADRPALAACARMFDDYPWLTTALAERAIETLRGRATITPVDVVEAAQLLEDEP